MRDTEELRDLYVASYLRVLAVVAAALGDPREAEDCVQEAFARAVPRWEQLSRYDNPEAWVRHVAMNLARSRWRRAKRFVELRIHMGDHVVSPVSPDYVSLLEALRVLPPDQREAIVLHYLVDLSVEEVAFRQGAPVGTVKARLSRGRRALARELGIGEEVGVDD